MRPIDRAIAAAVDRGDRQEEAFLRRLRTPDGGVKVFDVPGRIVTHYRERSVRLDSGDYLTTAKPVWGRR